MTYRVSLIVLLALCGCDAFRALFPPPPPPAGNLNIAQPTRTDWRFTDRTCDSIRKFRYTTGQEKDNHAILESLGGGVAVLDFDLDGQGDLFFPGGGDQTPQPESPAPSDARSRQLLPRPGACFRNRGQFQFDNVTAAAQLHIATHYTHGVAAADFDNDGFTDLLVTGYGGLQLFHNLGDGTFEECALAAGLKDSLWSSSAAWGDFNRDGVLDLYVVHYVDWSYDNHPNCSVGNPPRTDVCGPSSFQGLTDTLYLGTGELAFVDASTAWNIVPEGKGLGVLLADLDQDGDLDVLVANDTTNKFLYLNHNSQTFLECGGPAGIAVDAEGRTNGSMGLALLDFDGDGLPDPFVTNFEDENHGLYKNLGGGGFLCVSRTAGIMALGKLFVGFGTVAGDFDGDGDDDIMITNGHVRQHPRDGIVGQSPVLLENGGTGFFVRREFPPAAPLSQLQVGRGLAIGDLDHDGDDDFVFANVNEPPRVVENAHTKRHSQHLRLIGRDSNRTAIGAWIEGPAQSGRRLIRHVVGGGSYLSTSSPDLVIPCDSRPASTWTVHWPNGAIEQLTLPNQAHDLLIIEPRTVMLLP